jgi:hypothetical protein
VNVDLIQLGQDGTRHSNDIHPEDQLELLNAISKFKEAFKTTGLVVSDYKGVPEYAQLLPSIFVDEEPKPIKVAPAKVEETKVEEPKMEEFIAPSSGLRELTEAETKLLLAEAQKTQDFQLRSLTNAIKELVVVQEEAPKNLSQTEALQDPLRVK